MLCGLKEKQQKERNIQDALFAVEISYNSKTKEHECKIGTTLKKSAVLLQDSKIIQFIRPYNISFCPLILWYSGGYMAYWNEGNGSYVQSRYVGNVAEVCDN